jgi:hypothetical protein
MAFLTQTRMRILQTGTIMIMHSGSMDIELSYFVPGGDFHLFFQKHIKLYGC